MPISIDKPSKYFDTQLFTGTNTSGRTFTGLNFQPDMIWGKQRDSASYNHFIVDVVRGGSKFIATNSTASEDNKSHGEITSWNSDGTTWVDGTNATYPRLYYNDNGQLGGSGTRVWWQWKANGAGVSNTQGSITSTVSANTTSGFSISTYTGNGTSGANFGHGLGVKPACVIVKRRDTTSNWQFVSKALSATPFASGNYLKLNSTDGMGTNTAVWNAEPTSTLIYLTSSTDTNASSGTYVCYSFAEVKGFSKFGSYTGNYSTDGTFVYTGFKPSWVMVKNTQSTYNWRMFDVTRASNINPANKYLNANTSDAEGTTVQADMLSNGFKLRDNALTTNASGETYIYMAFAENPFVSSKGVCTTAR
jgi:hypothetical protein